MFTLVKPDKSNLNQLYMKALLPIFTIILISIFINAKGQSEPIEREWVKEDSIFIGNLSKAYKTNPLNVEQLLSCKGDKSEKLGFDYYLIGGSNGKGYVSIFYRFVYFKNKLVSYKLDPEMPTDTRLIERYLKFYSQLFNVSKDHLPEPLYFGYEEMIKPLNEFSGSFSSNKDIQFFMTPYSGIICGDYWGDPIILLNNRVVYLKIKKQITPEICELLLYSKNPATRLTAIEYYYQNPQLFSKNKERFENRIKVIFNELPVVSTMSADLSSTENARDLVNTLIKIH